MSADRPRWPDLVVIGMAVLLGATSAAVVNALSADRRQEQVIAEVRAGFAEQARVRGEQLAKHESRLAAMLLENRRFSRLIAEKVGVNLADAMHWSDDE